MALIGTSKQTHVPTSEVGTSWPLYKTVVGYPFATSVENEQIKATYGMGGDGKTSAGITIAYRNGIYVFPTQTLVVPDINGMKATDGT